MSILACKTRGDASPQGKPRVYFCCHPADFSLYFEPISEEVLRLQNCALYYPQNGAAVYDEGLLADLTQMQLFVMPVTEKLLTTENTALSVAFPFAVEHHIPVLPLMQEPGLDALFNQRCGERQYLDKHTADQTALRYEDKLKAYLEKVLVSDTEAEKVRGAFDTYIFLSYRKKDRRYAQELMRLIHQRPAYENMAIWYDEFLVPGENFNDNIQAALDKSALFVLTVTPNLVNETNYVMTVEYPMAVKKGKPIVAAEMLPTDKAAMAANYAACPPCTNAHDKPALSLALQEQLEKMTLQKNSDTKEQHYLMGLAYLNGIDVEVDHNRAVKRLTASAGAGYMPAIEKLIWMYRNGIGVERCMDTAIYWYEQLVSRHKELYNACPTVAALDKLVNCCFNFGDDRREYGQLRLAEEKYQQALAYLERTPFRRDCTVRQNFALCHERLGDLYLDSGAPAEASAHYQKAIDLREALLQESSAAIPDDLARSLAILYNKQSNLCQREGRLQEAREFCEKSLHITTQITEGKDTLLARQDRATCYDNLGMLCQQEGRLQEAEDYYRQSYQFCVAAVQEADSGITRRNLAVACGRLGWLYQQLGRLDEARKQCQNAYNLYEAMVQDMQSTLAYENLASAANSLGMVYQNQGNIPQAVAYYQQAVSLCERIAPAYQTPQATFVLGISYFYLAAVSPDKAVAYLQKSHSVFFELARQYPEAAQYATCRDMAASALGIR